MEKQVLSIERMQHLQELGLDTSKASMCWVKDLTKEIAEEKEIDMTIGWSLDFNNPEFYKYEWMKGIPTFTLQDILELLPKYLINNQIRYKLTVCFSKTANHWLIMYYDNHNVLEFYSNSEIIDAAYYLLCWCIENGYIKTK